LYASFEDACPVIGLKVNNVVIVEDPFSFRSDLTSHFIKLRNYFLVVEVQKVIFDEDSSEVCQVVCCLETDQAFQNVDAFLSVVWLVSVVKVARAEDLWQSDQGLQDFVGSRVAVPLQVEREYFRVWLIEYILSLRFMVAANLVEAFVWSTRVEGCSEGVEELS